MGMSAVQYKFMPEGLDVNFDSLKEGIKDLIEKNGGKVGGFEEQPIAFGLKALVVSFAYPEEKEIEELENSFKEVKGVSSVELLDYRRAIG